VSRGDECRLPRSFVAVSREALCEAAKEAIAGEPFEEYDLHALSNQPSYPRAHGRPDEEADYQQKK
jgi:hypothetical protein